MVMNAWGTRIALATALALGWASTAEAEDIRGVVALEAGLSLAEPSFVVGVEGGVRINGEWSVLLEIDANPWLTLNGPDAVTAGVLNIGVGAEHIYHGGTLRSAFFVGSSTLLFESALDQAGTTGFFIELLPVSVRIPIDRTGFAVRIDPVSMHLIVPSTSPVLPLIRYEFRHAVSLELVL
jgi:hypothetical protein